MQKRLDLTPTLFLKWAAKELARKMNADETGGWTYHVAGFPGDYCHLVAHDENGEFVGYF